MTKDDLCSHKHQKMIDPGGLLHQKSFTHEGNYLIPMIVADDNVNILCTTRYIYGM